MNGLQIPSNRGGLRRTVGLVALAGVVAVTAWSAANRLSERFSPDAARATPSPAVATILAQPAAVTLYSPAYRGSIETHYEATISARITAQVLESPWTPGDRVEADELLVRMDADEMHFEVQQRQATDQRLGGERATAQRNLERQQDLFARNLTPESELDDAHQRVATLEAQIRENRSALELARKRLEYATERAPIAAQVRHTHVRPGDLAVSGQPLIDLVGLDGLHAVLRVPERETVLLKPGLAVELTIPALDHVVTTRLDRVHPTLAAGRRSGSFETRLPEAPEAARPGMAVQARVILEHLDEATRVPAHAVWSDAGIHWVYRLEDGHAYRREVVTRSLPNGERAISEGIDPGDRIIVTPDRRIRDGLPVRDVNGTR
ncbi:multidrug-efflux system secretion protein, HlyD family [Thioalkalivibrio nitratireducens DSM 14787]|uniref:Multidrug-efflux system secretion protein, HlyD family n=1 Tax=Thioalkalivibrio nitratireducens (strain DSM 14787 / UNIQEM 213 / ALEN2) TaxID=1255043 RepID=L0DU27_THIND|nr:efflux RND transporter periplasmic adaptor subunit [Thioalkalivibrio nitratireducens]AGA32490.1 multidrug-efflux system secretion protein, HlyD family [Thioalkalivibrio nitratireducens DSM 14787]